MAVRKAKTERKSSVSSQKRRSHTSKEHIHGNDGRSSGTKLLWALLGAIVALGAAHHYARPHVASELADASLQWLRSHGDILPTPLLQQLEESQTEAVKLSDSFAVGYHMNDEGYKPKHPVILVPGVISTSLESWGLNGTAECPSKPHFRNRLWGGWYMIRTMLLDKSCWLQHIMLDKNTGLDPPNFKVRASQGLESADFFITGYWIWNKIIENLSAMGYDTDTMAIASYDWRLGYPDLERRDSFFSRLKSQIELMHKTMGEKVVLTGHSMGSQVIFYFFKWVESSGYGDGGSSWVNDHVEAYVDISGSMLGAVKAVPALLSGEMRDTVQLNALAVQGLERFFARHERAEMLRAMPGIASMLPKGGATIWGDMQGAPDDRTNETFGNFIRFAQTKTPLSSQNLTMEGALDLLRNQTPDWFSDRMDSMYSYGLAKTRAEVEANNKNPATWSNPLEAALPNAPDLKIYCFYGVGKDTERGYFYKDTTDDPSNPLNATIDYENRLSVIVGPGDGTITLGSHAMCHRWKDQGSKLNPGGAEVKVVEMLHQPDQLDLRGGARTAEHVDILGRTELNELVLRVASGRGKEITERVESNINDWVWDLDLGE